MIPTKNQPEVAKDPHSKILILDDEDQFLKLSKEYLTSTGFEVVTYQDGMDALNQLDRAHPDLMLVDVYMNGIDGFEFLKEVRKKNRFFSTPVILMTGQADRESVRRGMVEGADDFLPKPFQWPELLSTIHAQLKKQRGIEKLAKRNQEHLLAIIESTTDVIALLDQGTHRVFYLNNAGKKTVGVKDSNELSNLRGEDFLDSTFYRWLEAEGFSQAMNTGKLSAETVIVCQNGHSLPVSLLLLSHPREGFFSFIARDISQAKKSEQARREMEVQLRHSQKMESIGQLAAGIAHEINTPIQYVTDNTRFLQDSFGDLLRMLNMYQELLLRTTQIPTTKSILQELNRSEKEVDLEYLKEEIPKAICQSLEGADRVATIVRAMKDFSHPGTDSKSPIDLNQAIESTVTVARNEWKYVAQLVLDLDPELPPVPCLAGELNQVFLNLIVNASHAIEDVVGDSPNQKGTIKISTLNVEGGVEIRVSDTGNGIPKNIQGRIFEPFFTTKEVGKGTGQGLAIAHSVVKEKHGGRITFESNKAKGTTFIIWLPLESTTEMKRRAAC